MRIGIIGPSSTKHVSVQEDYSDILDELAHTCAKEGHELVVCADKGSVSEDFSLRYLSCGGSKVHCIVPQDDTEFGYGWLNTTLGENINCGTWRNQPETLNESCDALVCLGYGEGVLVEIAYSKWFTPKDVYILKPLVSGPLPPDATRKVKLHYVTLEEMLSQLTHGH